MVTEHKHFDDSSEGDDARLEQLLQAGFTVPEVRPEFFEGLKQDLDQEFLKQFPDEKISEHNGVLQNFPQLNGALETNGANGSRDLLRTATVDEDLREHEIDTVPWPADSGQEVVRSRRVLKWTATFAAAAALVLAIGFWGSRPAYGWAAMLEALKECEWVQAVVTRDGQQSSGWVSSSRGVWAVQSAEQTFFHDLQNQELCSFESSHNLVWQREQQTSQWDWQSLLIAILAEELDLPDSAQLETLMSARLLDESWEAVPADNEHGNLIKLQVTLAISEASRQLELEFLLDPQTHLPLECRVVSAGQQNSVSYDLSYPEQGPDSIFYLDVPAETSVVAVLPTTTSGTQSPITRLRGDGMSEHVEAAETIDHFIGSPKADVDKSIRDEPVSAADGSLVASLPVVPASDPVELPDPLPLGELVEAINGTMSSFWEQQSVHPVQPAGDEEFLRRAYLDLTGRIPMVSEVYEFLEDESVNRRQRLVNRLLESRDHATHLAAVWRNMLIPDSVDLSELGGTSKFDEWLAQRFGDNQPYNQLAEDLLLAQGRVSESGPILFYAALKMNPEELAGKTSRVFLGTRMECAQCHDHFFDDITQEEFWGLAAFFAQISRPAGMVERISSMRVLRVHDIETGEVTLPETDQVIKPWLPGKSAPLSPLDEGNSRREQLVDWLTAQDNLRFSRATVNIVWGHLFGRGLVNPIDDMRPDNPPVCPEMLDLLSKDFAASGFDLRRLIRALALSEAYQLSSGAEADEPAQSLNFARMNMKTFTAAQLYDCIAVSTRNEGMLSQAGGVGTLARISNSQRAMFIEQFRAPAGERTNYEAGIPQALTMMNGTMVHASTELASSGLLRSLQAPFFDDLQRVETLFLATLSRMPTRQEHARIMAILDGAESLEQRNAALEDILWALLNCAEFTFIH